MSKKVMRKSTESTDRIRTGAAYIRVLMISWSIPRNPSWRKSKSTACSITSCCHLSISSWKRTDAPAVSPVTGMPSRI